MKKTGQLITVLLLAALLLIAVSGLSGYRKYAVTSASMAPAIPVGSCVFVHAVPFGEITEQSVITYRLGNGMPVTHRVVAIDEKTHTFVTKGDANEQPDASGIPYTQIIGKVCFSVPYLGFVLIFLQSICGRILLAGTVLAAAICELLLIDPKRKRGKL